jgi:hypothetical protein
MAAFDRRLDQRPHVLGAVGRVEQEFGERVNLLLRVEQRGAQAIAKRCSTRLTRLYHIAPAQAQLARQQPQLRGFPASVNALKGDKSSGQLYRLSP